MKKLILIAILTTSLFSCKKDKENADFSKDQSFTIECNCDKEIGIFRYWTAYTDNPTDNNEYQDVNSTSYSVNGNILHDGLTEIYIRVHHYSVENVNPPVPVTDFTCSSKITVGNVVVLDTTQTVQTSENNGVAIIDYTVNP